jgi:SAM-dependent methyltransferase
MTETNSLQPSIALCAYAEPLASNRRVLVFGNALGSLPAQLMERGARSVHVCDIDAVRVSEAAARNRSTQIAFSSLADSDLSLRDAAFELAVVDNLGAYDPLQLLRTVKRALGPRGAAVIACPNPEAAFPLLRTSARDAGAASLDYYALYDAVAAEFEHVRMLGQTPFVGYAIADFSASGEPEPALDTSFVPGGAEEPDFFIALASNQELRLDEFAVIQLPTRRVLSSIQPPPAAAPAVSSEDLKAREVELTRLNQWIKELESRASTADERADHSETELEAERAKLEAERAKVEVERAKVEVERAKVEAERRTNSELKTRYEQELGVARAELDALRAQGTQLREHLDNQANELSRVTSELAARTRQLAEQAEKTEQASAAELAEFERQLTERGTEVRRLEDELRTAERTGRELVRELERRGSEQSKHANLELERALAEREADLQAAAWTIESLSLRLELAGKPATADGSALESALPSEEAR